MTVLSDSPPKPAMSNSLRWLLISSLAVNLAVGGIVLGAVLHGGSGARDMVRDIGFGPFDAALRPQDRDALKALLRSNAGDLKSIRAETAADLQQILAALRADPFDPASLDTAFAVQQDHLLSRMRLGNQTMRDFLAGLSAQDRLDFASRLEQRLSHGRDDAPSIPKI